LPTLPFTFGLEIIAEAARAIRPDRELVEIVEVEARRWIAIDDAGELPLKVVGRLSGADRIVVEVFPEGEDRASLVGTAVLASARRSPAPPVNPPKLDRPSPCTGEQFYAAGPLFHGPMFHVIRELREIGDDAASADVLVSDPAPWFSEPPAEGTILNPVLLDGLAQVAGYRAWLDGVLVLPVSLGRMTVFEALPPPGAVVRCVARLSRNDGRLVDIDIDAFSDDGRPLLRLEGLRSWRVFCHPSLLELNHRPHEIEIARRWRLPDGTDCFSVGLEDLGDLGPDWIARLYLDEKEWRRFRSHGRIDWLLGRIAAKDALRDRMRSAGGVRHPIEISIDNSADGTPEVTTGSGRETTAFSIAHIADQAVAVSSDGGSIGIDLVAVEERPNELVTVAFDEAERKLIGDAGEDAGLALHRAWAAKEAAAKAHGWGLEGLARVRLTTLGPDGVEVTVSGGDPITVVTAVGDGRVVAVARRPER
jgi:phosphopantetheinyl transferase